MNPILLASLLGDDKCEEVHKGGCTQPTTANDNERKLCGIGDTQSRCMEGGSGPARYNCCPCCTCPDTPNKEGGCGGSGYPP